MCVWKRCRIPSPFTFYEKKTSKLAYTYGGGGWRTRSSGGSSHTACEIERIGEEAAEESKRVMGRVTVVVLTLVPEKKMDRLYTGGHYRTQREVGLLYPGSDWVTKEGPPLRMAKLPGIGEGRVSFFPLTHTRKQYTVCVCVCVGEQQYNPKENEVQSRIGSSGDPFFPLLASLDFSYIYL